jgi:hypothetical protein
MRAKARKDGTGIRRVGGEVELDAHRAFERTGHGRQIAFEKTAEARRRQVARDAIDAEAIRTVRRDRDLDHGIVPPKHFRRRRSHREVALQVDDAFMLVGEFELALGTHHAVRLDAANFRRFQHHAVDGDRRTWRRKDTGHAGACIRCAADDL